MHLNMYIAWVICIITVCAKDIAVFISVDHRELPYPITRSNSERLTFKNEIQLF